MKLTPKGMRDIPPEDMYVREEVVEEIRRIFKLYGFRPLETPAMEYLDTLKAKAGTEVEKQIFVIEGGEYGLRFDLTVPLARYVASTEAPKPFKRYAIDVVWRREEPQRGRFREFYQADIDIVGSKSLRCEAELLRIALEICNRFEFGNPRILLNNRKILDGLAAKLNIPEETKSEIFRILDKMDKIGGEETRRLLKEILGERANEVISITTLKGTNKERLRAVSKYSSEGAAELEQIIELCDFEIEIEPALVRGLGYYTGPIFEIKLSQDIGTVIAGGRYDHLISRYGQPSPAVGISVGIERLITLILEREKERAKTKKTDTKIIMAVAKPEFYEYSLEIAEILRKNGIECETDLNERNLRQQLDYANALGIKYVGIVGEREKRENSITLKDMEIKTENYIRIKELLNYLRS